PVLRIETHCLAGRDAEKPGVESVDRFQEPAAAGADLAGRIRIGIVEPLEAPTLRRHLANRVDAVLEQLPVAVGIVRAAWETAADADHRNRLVALRGRAFR